MSKQLDELLELDGTSTLFEVGVGNGVYPPSFFMYGRVPLTTEVSIKNTSPLDAKPIPRREFKFIKDYGDYALYKEIPRRDK